MIKQTFYKILQKIDHLMISKKDVPTNIVKEIIRGLSESDDKQV